MFAEKKLFYCFHEQFVFQELHSENDIILHVKSTGQIKDNNFISGNSECKRIGNKWKREGKHCTCKPQINVHTYENTLTKDKL